MKSFNRVVRALLCITIAVCSAEAGDLLVLNQSTLTHYAGGATNIQDVQPRFEQRGVGIDGSERTAPTFPWLIAGNPFPEEWNSHRYFAGVDLATGCLQVNDIDISLPTLGPRWIIGRTFNSRQATGAGVARDSTLGPQGRNWFQSSMPEIVLHSAESNADDVLYLVYGADRFLEFKRHATDSDTFEGRNGTGGVFVRTANNGGSSTEPDTYAYYDASGGKTVFFGFDTDSGAAAGQIWKVSDPAGNTAYVGDASTASTAITNGYQSGKVKTAYDASGHRFSYTYSTIDSVSRLTQVLAETKSGGSWHSAGSDVFVTSVDYAYYSGSDSNGDNGNLKLVTVTSVTSDSSHNAVRQKYYRYWTGSYNSSTNHGHPNLLKLVLGYEGARKYEWTNSSPKAFASTPLYFSASTNDLKSYSDAYLEYDSDRHISTAFFNGQCGCGGGGNGTHNFWYGESDDYSDYLIDSAYENAWATRTIVQKPGDGSTWITQYFDEVAQPLSLVESLLDPTSTEGNQYWAIRIDRSDSTTSDDSDSKGRVVGCIYQQAFAGLSSYDHDSGVITVHLSTARTFDRLDSSSPTNLNGLLTSVRVLDGTTDDPYFERQMTYSAGSVTVGGVSLYRPYKTANKAVKNTVTSGLPSSSDVDSTSYAVSFHSSSLAMKQVVTTYPLITSAEHGSGSADTSVKDFRADGTLAFFIAEDGIARFTRYAGGKLVEDVSDAKSKTYATEDNPSTWSLTLPSGGLDVGEAMAYDPIGRLVTSTRSGDGRVMRTFHTVLDDRRLVELYIPKEVAGSPTAYYGPVDLTIFNHAGKREAEGTVALASSAASTTVSLTSWVLHGTGGTVIDDAKAALYSSVGVLGTLTTNIYSDSGVRLDEARSYTGASLPSSLPGTENTDYDATKYAYDDAGRLSTTTDPSGTSEERQYTHRGGLKKKLVGTSSMNRLLTYKAAHDGDSDTDPIFARFWCHGGSLVDLWGASQVGTSPGDDPGLFLTHYDRDARDLVQMVHNPSAPHRLIKRDVKGRPIAIGFYGSDAIVGATDDPTTTATDRVGLIELKWDGRDRIYQYINYFVDIDPDTNEGNLSSGQFVTSGTWYDGVGRVLKVSGPTLEKYKYDRLGRRTHRFVLGYTDDSDTSYSDATSLTDDVVLEEHQSVFDNTSGQELLHVVLQRPHNATNTGALDSNADSDLFTLTSTDAPHARAQITASWYDGLDRLTTTADYGTNSSSGNVATFTRTSLSEPTSTTTGVCLVEKVEYDQVGRVKFVTNPNGIKHYSEYDLSSRLTKSIANYVDGTPGSGDDDDVTTAYQYLHPSSGPGLIRKVIAVMPSSGDNQETTYTYGVSEGDSPASEINSGNLLREVKYPDSSGPSDVVLYSYARGGMVQGIQDQAGNVLAITFDGSRRETKREVVTFGSSDFSDYVKSISREYDSRGDLSRVVQSSNDSPSAVRDEMEIHYNGWGAIEAIIQDPDSSIAGSGRHAFQVQFAYALSTASRNTVRRSSMTLPSGQVVNYQYDSSGSVDDDASRVSGIAMGSTRVASYKYMGAGRLVGTDYNEVIDADYRQYDSTSGDYSRLDRFNRVKTSVWNRTSATKSIYEVSLAYDSNDNPTSVDDAATVYTGDGWDAKYTMDALDRVTRTEEGTLSGGSISSRTRDEQWQYSHTGNWKRHKLDLNGDDNFNDSGTDEIDDTATFNKANEWLTRDTDSTSGTTGNNLTLARDAVGNLVNDGKSLKLKYDPFGRLVEVRNQSDQLLAEYRYNGLGYVIADHEDRDIDFDVDSSDAWVFHAYDDKWRRVASFRAGVDDDEPKEETVFQNAGASGMGGSSYVDDVLLRSRDAIADDNDNKRMTWTRESDGLLEETIYFCENWHHDVVVTLNDSGQPIDRTLYSTYGVPFMIPASDLNGDGQSDLTDFFAYFDYFDVSDIRADVNCDGVVDLTDFFMFFNDFDDSPAGGRGVVSRSSIASIHGFAGYQYDSTTLLNNVRNRWYVPELGRWATRDPLGYVDGLNQYQYVSGRPLSFTDKLGLLRLGGDDDKKNPSRDAIPGNQWPDTDELQHNTFDPTNDLWDIDHPGDYSKGRKAFPTAAGPQEQERFDKALPEIADDFRSMEYNYAEFFCFFMAGGIDGFGEPGDFEGGGGGKGPEEEGPAPGNSDEATEGGGGGSKTEGGGNGEEVAPGVREGDGGGSAKNPPRGKPNSEVTLKNPDGTVRQVRRYGSDGRPEVDVDYSHPHELQDGEPVDVHAHDWTRRPDGTPARNLRSRPVGPNDPKPN